MSAGRPDDSRPDESEGIDDDPAADDRTVAGDDLDAVLGQFGDEPADDRTVAADGVIGRGPGATDATDATDDRTAPDELSVPDRSTGRPATGVDAPGTTPPARGSTWTATGADGTTWTGTGAGGTSRSGTGDDAWKPSVAGPVPPAPGAPGPTGSEQVGGAMTGPAPGSVADQPVVPPAPPEAGPLESTMPPAPGFDPSSGEQRWRPPARTREVIEPGSSRSWPVWLIPIVVLLAIASIVALVLLS